jgi:aryl-alcohol dehydrogenase-like predicted oxidoreductase
MAAKVGVSVYTPDELNRVLDRFVPQIVQLPFSVVDRRFLGLLPHLRAAGTEVHVRSIFLQGLLLLKADDLPSRFDRARPLWRSIDDRARRAGIDRLTLCLGFALRHEALDRIVVGVASAQQLADIVAAAERSLAAACEFPDLASDDETLLLPSLWDAA